MVDPGARSPQHTPQIDLRIPFVEVFVHPYYDMSPSPILTMKAAISQYDRVEACLRLWCRSSAQLDVKILRCLQVNLSKRVGLRV